MLWHLLRDKAALLLQYSANGLLPLLMVPYVLGAIGPAEFGRLAVALSLGGIAAVIVQYSFNLSGPKLLAESRTQDQRRAVFASVTLIKFVLLGLVLALVSMGLALVRPDAGRLTLMMVSALAVAAASNSTWVLQFENRFPLVAGLSIVATACAIVFGFALVSKDAPWSTWYGGITLVLAPTLVGGLTLVTAIARLRARFDLKALSGAGALVRSGVPLFASQFCAALYGGVGAIVVASMLGIEAAGRYGAFERILTAVIGACTLIHVAAYPRLVKAYSQDFALYRRLIGATLSIYFALVLTIIVATSLQSDLIFRLLFHGTIHASDPMVLAGALLMATSIFGPLLTGYLVARGEGGRVLGLTLRLLLISMVLGLPGAKFLGAWAWLGALAVAQLTVATEAIVLFSRDFKCRERMV